MTTPAMNTRVPQFELCDRLRRIRREQNLSQSDFAQRLGVKPQAYSAWESGRNTPRADALLAIAKRIEMMTAVPAWWTLGLESGGPSPADGDATHHGDNGNTYR